MEDADFDFGFDDSFTQFASEYDKMLYDRKKWLQRSQFECKSCNETSFATGQPRCHNCGDSMVKFKTKREFKASNGNRLISAPKRYTYSN